MTDPLTDLLRSVRLTGSVFLEAHFSAPWCVTSKLTADDCRTFLPNPVQMIAYHFVLEGKLLLLIEGGPPIEVNAGEIVLLPRNDSHVLTSAVGLAAVSAGQLIQPSGNGGLAFIRHGGGGDTTRIVCGFLGTDDRHNPLFASLPSALTLDFRQATSGAWVEASVRFAADELAAGRFTSMDVLARLSELLLVEAVRQYSSTRPERETGWLKGARDPQIGRALAVMHQNIDTAWSAEKLANEVAMSRSAFIEKFSALVGTPPIRYLTIRRLQTAQLQLLESPKSVGQIARAVGYESEEAFSRAFKREFGAPPAQWRERARAR